jgi:hypothetical protein
VWANTSGCADGPTITTGTCPTVPLGSIGDLVWKDLNGNGIQDDGPNSGMSDVPVSLFRENGTPGQFTVVANTTTSQSGFYSFTGLTAGNYKVHIDVDAVPFYCQPTTQTVVTLNDATNSKINDQGDTPVITLNPADPNQRDYSNADAGFKVVPLGSLGDYVWKDTNNDGIQNDGNTGVAGLGVKLLNSNGVYVVRGILSGAQEVPSVPTSGSGLIYAIFNPANNVLMLVTGFEGLSGTSTMAHPHGCSRRKRSRCSGFGAAGLPHGRAVGQCRDQYHTDYCPKRAASGKQAVCEHSHKHQRWGRGAGATDGLRVHKCQWQLSLYQPAAG